jgi:hypothetical protein
MSEKVAEAFGRIMQDNDRIESFELRWGRSDSVPLNSRLHAMVWQASPLPLSRLARSLMFDHVTYAEVWLPSLASARNLQHLGLQKVCHSNTHDIRLVAPPHFLTCNMNVICRLSLTTAIRVFSTRL